VNQPDDAGMTPLHLAVDVEADGARQLGESPDVETTRLLLELGADPDAADQRGKTPRTLAEEYAHEGALSLMARRNGPS
jgi:ankyrin repeat protein